ncbi:MAG: DUF465 domain-containing protein [Rhizobiales bacterium]|nr:DUF465 domain-containing protein [Hyphomicrobiales bacterium]MBN9010245.1 DUF465 domain-containing protein [Hyphomicrobiales bacterium]
MASGNRSLSGEAEEQIRRELAKLREEHRDLDEATASMIASGTIDSLRIQRMKKRKLALKDRMSALEDQLLPDIIA